MRIESHTVGIDVSKQLIYYCMEENVLVLNKKCPFIVVRMQRFIRLKLLVNRRKKTKNERTVLMIILELVSCVSYK